MERWKSDFNSSVLKFFNSNPICQIGDNRYIVSIRLLKIGRICPEFECIVRLFFDMYYCVMPLWANSLKLHLITAKKAETSVIPCSEMLNIASFVKYL